jgi:hypothetical protein
MRIATCVLAVVVVATAAGCAEPYYGNNGPRYGYNPSYSPNYAYAPQYSNETPASRYGYSSRGEYYRNYGGIYHPGPEQYP